MIEKKTPKVSDGAEPEIPAATPAIAPEPDDLASAGPAAPEPHFEDRDEEEAVRDDYEIDPVEEARKRKQRSDMIFYGGIALVALVVGYISYPHFKKYFVKDEPQTHQLAGVPFPAAAAKNHFLLSSDEPKPQAPAGGIAGGAPIGAVGSPNDPDSSPPPVAVAPDSHADLPTTVAPRAADTARADIDALTGSSGATAPADKTPQPATPVFGTDTVAVAPPAPAPSSPAPAVAQAAPSSAAVPAPAPSKAESQTSSPQAQAKPGAATPPGRQASQAGALPLPAVVASGAGTPPPAPSQADAAPGQLGDLAGKVSALQGSVASLASSRDATNARLQQIQASLDRLQQQIGDLARISGAPAGPPKNAAARDAAVRKAQPVAAARPAGKWELRSATPDMALLGHPGDQDLHKVMVGDMVSGLGRITSIAEHDGNWVVQGTSGRVVQ